MILCCFAEHSIGQGEDTQFSFSEQTEELYFIPFLQAQGDGLTRMMAFDWGLQFFRNRGRQANFNRLRVNGLLMNSLLDGSIPWKEIAGLNEQFRFRQIMRPEALQEYGPPALGESQAIELSPFNNRLQSKFVLSAANRFYRYRYGFSSTVQSRGGDHRMTISLTNRSGGIRVPLNSFSYLVGWGHKPKPAEEWGLYFLGVASQRGKTSPQTREVYSLAGHDYNPNGGYWKGRFKSSRLEIFHRPWIHGYYKRETLQSKWMISSAYQWGKQMNTRLGFRDAPHPNPSYYKYLPSYYDAKALGNRFDLLEIRDYFKTRPLLDWSGMYLANQNSKNEASRYALLGDTERLSRLVISVGYWRYGERSQWYAGLLLRREASQNYQTPIDLLGGAYWLNTDSFSQLSYDISSDPARKTGEITHHRYILSASQLELSGHFIRRISDWTAQVGGALHLGSGGREGLLRNELFPNSSLGKSGQVLAFGASAFVIGSWNVTLRQQILLSMSYQRLPVPLENHFVEREFSNRMTMSSPEMVQKAISLEFRRRQPQWNGRLTFFLNQVSGESASRSSYLETAFGEGLLTESVLDQQSHAAGFEGYLKWKLNEEFNIDLGWQFRRDYWINKPKLIWSERPGLQATPLFTEGVYNAGKLDLKGLHRGLGPENALGVRVSYRSPEYWWVQSGIHTFWGNYISPALNRYSDAFLLAPSGSQDLSLTAERQSLLRRQEALPSVGYLHIAGGKSWKKGKRFSSMFISLQNVLGTKVPTGGFQQNRVAHARLALEEHNSPTPLFANKYWMGSSRTFFLNLSTSF